MTVSLASSIKALTIIANERAEELHAVLEVSDRRELERLIDCGKYPVTHDWYYKCFHLMEIPLTKLSIASEIMGGSGVECLRQGSDEDSPAVDYVNMGDMDAPTLMWIEEFYNTSALTWSSSRWVVTSVSDIIEHSDYRGC